MFISDWYNLLTGISVSVTAFLFIRDSVNKRVLSSIFLSLASIAVIIGILFSYVDGYDYISREWGNLIAISMVMSALYEKIRLSKPVFARFPSQLTYIPLAVILFYPLIVDAEIVKDLLFMTYEGGLLLVSILLFSNNYKFYERYLLLITGLIILSIAFVFRWIIVDLELSVLISNMAFNAGIIIFSLGLVTQKSKLKS